MKSDTTSGTSSTSGEDDLLAATRQLLSTLHVQRQSLESEAEAIVSELTTPPAPDMEPMGIDTPLVDQEGYPRNDIDIYRARTLRSRLAVIRNDHKALMKEAERYLQQLARLQNPAKVQAARQEVASRIAPKPKPKYDPVTGKWVVRNWDGTLSGSGTAGDEKRLFDTIESSKQLSSGSVSAGSVSADAQAADASSMSSAAAAASASAMQGVVDNSMYNDFRPFARVNSVADNSPAFQAGLQVEDLIVKFENISLVETENPMQSIGQVVPQIAAQQQSVTVVVRRQRQLLVPQQEQQPSEGEVVTLKLSLTPRPWAGRGLLGCHILPYVGGGE